LFRGVLAKQDKYARDYVVLKIGSQAEEKIEKKSAETFGCTSILHSSLIMDPFIEEKGKGRSHL
jgi:NifU-like protein involved in Fe-S cluster formation